MAANGHLLRRAIEHGVAPGPWLQELELPRNMAPLMSGGDASRGGWRDRIRRLIWRWRPPRGSYVARGKGVGSADDAGVAVAEVDVDVDGGFGDRDGDEPPGVNARE